MNQLKNRVQLIGRLGNDPEVKKFNGEKTMARMNLATNDVYKNNKGEKVEDTQWHNIVAWGGLATVAEKYLKKGSEIAVEGKLVHRSYDDKDGNKKYITEILIHDLLMLRKKEK